MKYYIVIQVDDGKCPECGWDVNEHHANCPIGRIVHVVVDETAISPTVKTLVEQAQ